MRHIVTRRPKPAGWWTPVRKQTLWDMYVEGKSFEDMAKAFGVTIASVQRTLYKYKKEQQQ
jgi:transposase